MQFFFAVVLVLLLQACLAVAAAQEVAVVDIQVHYPASELHPLPSGAVFSLALCYQPHCTVSDSLWNQTAPGAPYDPRLTIFQGDYAGNDLFVKRVTLPEHPGEDVVVFATIYAAFDPPGNPFGSCAVKDACNTSGFDPVSNACVHVGMPYRSVRQSTGKLLVVAFPYFGMKPGSVYTLLPSFHSPQLQNARDINVYVPASLLQNSVSRAVNVLVINDGTSYFLEQLAFAGGLDHALLTGAVPETIMIGLPQNGTGCQRQYELTFAVATARSPCNVSGGAAFYLAFIRDSVVPAATAALNITLGEVSMAGASYGGLTACFAAAAQPEYFRRVFCQSPSVWWNYGELANVITANAAASLQRPLAVVVYIGSTEMGSPLCTSVACTSTKTWFTYVNETVQAFRVASGDVSLHFFTLAGGQHDATAWATTFAVGVTEMFATNSTTPFQMLYTRKSAVNVLYPPSTDCSAAEASSKGGVNIAWVMVLATLLGVETVAVVTGWWVLRRRRKNDSGIGGYIALSN